MKKPYIVWIIAAVFLFCSFSLFAEGDIGAGLCGIVVAVALAIYGYKAMKKAQAAAEEEKRAEEERQKSEQRKRDYEARHGLLEIPVAGVMFENDDGTERQRILANIYKENEGGGVVGALQEYEYKGNPAVRVTVEDKCIGVIRNADLPEVLPIVNKIEIVAIYVEHFKDEDGKKVYRADLRIEYAK